MRKALLLIVLLVLPCVATAQFPGVDLTGSVSASVGAPIGCESCEDVAFHTTVGIVIKNRIGFGYRGLRWGDQNLTSDHRMSTDMFTADLFLVANGRVRPFVSGGGGHTSAKLVNVFEGGHAHSNYGPASGLRTTFWGAGLDFRLFSRVALTAMVSRTATSDASTRESCTQYNYLSGDFSYTCGTSGEQKYAISGLSIGLAIR